MMRQAGDQVVAEPVEVVVGAELLDPAHRQRGPLRELLLEEPVDEVGGRVDLVGVQAAHGAPRLVPAADP